MKKLSVFRELRSFLLLWSSQAVSELGTAMTEYALIVWVYGQRGTASSITLLTICSFLPTILFRFIAGALVDRWDKKRVMLLADLAAAGGTAVILTLHALGGLRVWHLYLINAALSFLSAFQHPASFVATSLLVPKKHYTRASGLQSLAGSVVSILAPALGGVLLAFGGLDVVLICDLASFGVAFIVLLLFIRIPDMERGKEARGEPFLQSCLGGIRYLRDHAAILRITLFFAVVNFLAKLGNDGMISPFVLARTGGSQQVLGAVQSATAAGLFAGGLLVTLSKPARRKTRAVFLACACVFFVNVAQALTRLPLIWCAAAFAAYATAVVMNANLTAVLRENVPPEMQGRVFSTQNTLQNGTIPLALFLGGILADRVFEPLMAAGSSASRVIARIIPPGNGAGIAVMMLIVGILGMLLSLTRLRKSVYRELDTREKTQ